MLTDCAGHLLWIINGYSTVRLTDIIAIIIFARCSQYWIAARCSAQYLQFNAGLLSSGVVQEKNGTNWITRFIAVIDTSLNIGLTPIFRAMSLSISSNYYPILFAPYRTSNAAPNWPVSILLLSCPSINNTIAMLLSSLGNTARNEICII